MTVITSRSNNNIKRILMLRDRKFRTENKIFGVEGAREIGCALQNCFEPVEVLYSNELLSDCARSIFEKQLQCNKEINILKVSPEVFDKLTVRSNSDGLFVVFRNKNYYLEDISQKENLFFVLLDNIEKPGNLGAVLRTSDGAGVDAVIVVGEKVDIFNPNVIRSSLGGVFTQPIISVSIDEALNYLKRKNVKIVCASPNGKRFYYQSDLCGDIVLVFGSEAYGISRRVIEHADEEVMIPMQGDIDSLNISVAAGILIYDVIRQRSNQ